MKKSCFAILLLAPSFCFAQAIELGTGGGGVSSQGSSASSTPIYPSSSLDGSLTQSRAGSGVANESDLDSFTTNPAGMIFSSGRGSSGGGYFVDTANMSKWSVGLVDGRKAVIGGLRYDYTSLGDADRQGIHTGASYRTKYGSMGATFSTYYFDGLTEHNGWHFTQSLGIIAPVAYGFTIGIAGHSFLDKAPDALLNPTLAVGLSYQKSKVFKLSFQADRRFELEGQDFNYSFSNDLILKRFFVIRTGYRWDNSTDDSYFTTGIALEAPRMHLSGHYARAVEGDQDQGFGGKLIYFF